MTDRKNESSKGTNSKNSANIKKEKAGSKPKNEYFYV